MNYTLHSKPAWMQTIILTLFYINLNSPPIIHHVNHLAFQDATQITHLLFLIIQTHSIVLNNRHPNLRESGHIGIRQWKIPQKLDIIFGPFLELSTNCATCRGHQGPQTAVGPHAQRKIKRIERSTRTNGQRQGWIIGVFAHATRPHGSRQKKPELGPSLYFWSAEREEISIQRRRGSRGGERRRSSRSCRIVKIVAPRGSIVARKESGQTGDRMLVTLLSGKIENSQKRQRTFVQIRIALSLSHALQSPKIEHLRTNLHRPAPSKITQRPHRVNHHRILTTIPYSQKVTTHSTILEQSQVVYGPRLASQTVLHRATQPNPLQIKIDNQHPKRVGWTLHPKRSR
jgi:hypothetical protein